MMANARALCVVLLGLFIATSASSQMSEQDVRARLDAVYAGKADQVSRELPALFQQYPHDAGVLYIQAVLTTDGTLAVKRYEEIAEKHPQSIWADDALYKVYQYNFSLGLYKKADDVMAQLRSRYPQSIYVTGAESKPPQPETGSAVAAAPAKAVSQSSVQQAAATGKFYVQVGVFSTEANARRAAEQYGSKAGRKPAVTQVGTTDKPRYLVRFDGFETEESARSFSVELRTKHQIESFVFPYPNAR
jgi:cell division septation protein DedD